MADVYGSEIPNVDEVGDGDEEIKECLMETPVGNAVPRVIWEYWRQFCYVTRPLHPP